MMVYGAYLISHDSDKKIVIECEEFFITLRVLYEDKEIGRVALRDYEARLLGNLFVDLARHVETNTPLYYE